MGVLLVDRALQGASPPPAPTSTFQFRSLKDTTSFVGFCATPHGAQGSSGSAGNPLDRFQEIRWEEAGIAPGPASCQAKSYPLCYRSGRQDLISGQAGVEPRASLSHVQQEPSC